MNPRQHSILTHLQRIVDALLPGGTWHLSRLSAAVCPAERVASRATDVKAMRKHRGQFRGSRTA